MASQKDQDALENLLDKLGVRGLLEALSIIAVEKADHVATNWQDQRLARRWEKLAGRFQTAARTVDDPYEL